MNFALIGAAGYIAPRHLKAIKDTGNQLVTAFDPFDSVGILDRYFNDVNYFKEFERFDRHAEKLRREDSEKHIDYVSICSPNFLHDAHIRFALRIGADIICEKPIVLNPWNLDAISELEKETGRHVYTVFQLRLHPSMVALKNKVEEENKKDKYHIDLTYITGRGSWYFYSWKGDMQKSGGLGTNIGIHFFDMLTWIFGKLNFVEVHFSTNKTISGFFELEKATVRWFLSVDKNDLQYVNAGSGQSTFRSILIDNEEIEFSDGFADLHTEVYKRTLDGNGFTIDDARPSVEIAHKVRHAIPVGLDSDNLHPILQRLKIG